MQNTVHCSIDPAATKILKLQSQQLTTLMSILKQP